MSRSAKRADVKTKPPSKPKTNKQKTEKKNKKTSAFTVLRVKARRSRNMFLFSFFGAHVIDCHSGSVSARPPEHDSEDFHAIFASTVDSTPVHDPYSVYTTSLLSAPLLKVTFFGLDPHCDQVHAHAAAERGAGGSHGQGEKGVSFEGLRHALVAFRRVLWLHACARVTGSFRQRRPRYSPRGGFHQTRFTLQLTLQAPPFSAKSLAFAVL